MFCPHCGAQNDEDSLYCGACGLHLMQATAAGPPAAPPAAELAPASWEEPAPARPARAPTATTNSLAIVSLVLGILGLLSCLCGAGVGGLLTGLGAVVTGWLAHKQIAQGPADPQGQRFAAIGLALGTLEVLLGIIGLLVTGSVRLLGWLVG